MKILKWAPRILTIIYICFISLFALDEWGQWLGMLIHLIPSFALIGILVIAWKWPRIGGLIFIGMGILFTIFFNTYEQWLSFLTISLPLFITGGLYYSPHDPLYSS